jgi:hypothetical protein
MAKPFTGYPLVIATGVSITTSGTSASTTLPNGADGTIPKYVRIAATAAAHVRFGKTSATAVVTDILIQPGDAQIVAVPGGTDTVAAIQNAAAGKVVVTPLENS